jgi:hypothetical protein
MHHSKESAERNSTRHTFHIQNSHIIARKSTPTLRPTIQYQSQHTGTNTPAQLTRPVKIQDRRCLSPLPTSAPLFAALTKHGPHSAGQTAEKSPQEFRKPVSAFHGVLQLSHGRCGIRDSDADRPAKIAARKPHSCGTQPARTRHTSTTVTDLSYRRIMTVESVPRSSYTSRMSASPK